MGLEIGVDLGVQNQVAEQGALGQVIDGEGELPPVSEVAALFTGRVPEGVLYCVRAALQSEFEV